MLYLLPTRADRRYTGKHPNRIHSISMSGTDADGNRAAHWETNAGERYTCSYDRLEMERMNRTRTFVGTAFTEFVRNGTVVTPMSQDTYDHWLAIVRRQRQDREAIRAQRRTVSTNWLK